MELPPISEHRFVLIIGAGASGIIQATELLRKRTLPPTSFAILDKYTEFGGCWVQNTYPGCACDTWSHIYEVSWRRNPDWLTMYAKQPEIKAYFQAIAADFKLHESTHFQTEVISARFVESKNIWLVEAIDLQNPTAPKKFWTCNYLITALGPFTVPKKIPVPGVDSFIGKSWNAMNWPPTWASDITNKTVAVIGTGPSAAQFIPFLQEKAQKLIVYQRNPGHVFQRNETEIPAWLRFLFRWLPWTLSVYAWWLLQWQEVFMYYMTQRDSFAQSVALWGARRHCASKVKDEEKREKLMPKDQFGCKRPLFLDRYYPAMDCENVEVVTEAVEGVTEGGVVSGGTERRVDVLVWATGYVLGTHFQVYGRGGKVLQEYYGKEIYTLYGITVDEFPNLGNFLGPYSVGYWTPVIEQIELTAAYNRQLIEALLQANKSPGGNKAFMLKREAVVEWVESLREGQQKLVAAIPSCVTYYKTEHGTILNIPYKIGYARKFLRRVELEKHYVMLEPMAVDGNADGSEEVGTQIKAEVAGKDINGLGVEVKEVNDETCEMMRFRPGRVVGAES